MYTMNNHTTRESVTIDLQSSVSKLFRAKDTTQSLWETVGLLKKRCCHKNHCGRVACVAV